MPEGFDGSLAGGTGVISNGTGKRLGAQSNEYLHICIQNGIDNE